MKTPSVPAPPDPVATANAQAAANKDTAIAQQQLNMVDQYTPYGNLTYEQVGSWADGTPRFKSNTVLSPDQQRNLEQQSQFDNLVNQLGISQTQKLSGHLDSPINLNNEAVESRLMELGSKRLNPLFEQRRQSQLTELMNRGIAPGSEAFENERRALMEQENDAFNQLLLSGRGQAVQESLTARNQPINEITALMSGGQVSQPNFTGTPQTNVAGTDVAGLTMDAYRYGPLAQYQAKVGNQQAMMGGLFGLGGAALGGWGRSGFRI